MFMYPSYGGDSRGAVTATADTEFLQYVPPKRNFFTRITSMMYTSGGTLHTLTVMRPYGTTTLTAAAATGQAVVALAANPGTGTVPGTIAANDFVLIEKPDGTYHIGKVSSLSNLDLTLTANVPATGFASGARLWFFGAPSDTTNHIVYKPTVSTTTTYSDPVSGVACSLTQNQPLLLHSGNATAAGTLHFVSYLFTKVGPG